jgi:hypothetical protein
VHGKEQFVRARRNTGKENTDFQMPIATRRNTKHQTPNTKQLPNIKLQSAALGIGQRSGWGLKVGGYLVFGVWCLVFSSPSADLAPKFLGAQSCANSMCHGGAGEKRDQFITWSKKDFHTRAPATLSMARSTRIAETLKISDATSDVRCTSCHNPLQAVAVERRGTQIGKLEGVSCESCHNAAEPWLLTHTRKDLQYQQKVAAGLRDLKNLYVRANTCVACHQNVDGELRTAGHPELTFELDGQCATMPRHWAETNRWRGAQAWWVGQAVALREGAAQAEGKASPDVPSRNAALAWLLGIPAERGAADNLAREAAGQNWSEPEVRSRLEKLASTHAQFADGESSPEVAQRAERLVLGLERFMVALKWSKHPTLSPKLDQLFQDIQSRPDFAPKDFAAHLKAFADEVKTVGSR